jgi:hypothetical protein
MFVRYDSLAQDYLMATQHFLVVIYEEYQRFQHNFPRFENMTLRWVFNYNPLKEQIPSNIIMFQVAFLQSSD